MGYPMQHLARAKRTLRRPIWRLEGLRKAADSGLVNALDSLDTSEQKFLSHAPVLHCNRLDEGVYERLSSRCCRASQGKGWTPRQQVSRDRDTANALDRKVWGRRGSSLVPFAGRCSADAMGPHTRCERGADRIGFKR